MTVRRMLTQRPGLRASVPADAEDALITDFAAVLDFIEAGPAVLQEALRAAGTARHPWAACVASGLRRLPSFSGPVFTTTSRISRAFHGYAPGQPLIEPAFVFATSAPQVILDGDVEYVIWAETAKRVAALAPEASRDEVVFAAGTTFRVLYAMPGLQGAGTMRVFLRELPPAGGRSASRPAPGHNGPDQLDERDRGLLDRLGAAAALRDGLGAEERVRPQRHREPGPVLGIDRFGAPFRAG